MRNAYREQLQAVVDDLVAMTQQVQQAVSQATESGLRADGLLAERVISRDSAIDGARYEIEERCFELLALQQPVAGDLRTLIAAVRMLSDLERMGDLAVHVAKVARLRAPEVAVPSELVPTIARMGEVAERMVGDVAVVIADRDVQAAKDLETADEEMDDLRKASFRAMLDHSWTHGVEPAVDTALLGRYYERISDHAVSLARRVVYLVTGHSPSSVDA
jgi:phosphate transport system protein